jgi:hypothetical protein
VTWIAQPLTYLEFIHTDRNGKDYTESRRFDPRKSVLDFSVRAYTGDIEVCVGLYSVMHLKQTVNEIYENGIVNELFIGIRDGKKIDYMGKFWTPKQFTEMNIEQYFFKKNKPSSFDFGYRYGTGWPPDRSPVLDERLRVYFAELISRKDIGKRLLACISQLEKPGPEYKGISDGSIVFDMVKN